MNPTRDFFDRHSCGWDARENPAFAAVIERILDRFAPGPRDRFLDVACGTGVLVPYLERRAVSDYTALDFSEGMARRFSEKYPGKKILVADFQTPGLFAPASFSKIMIYNAFPHFSEPGAVFANAYELLKSGGELCIAHSMDRQRLNSHHARSGVSGDRLVSDAEIRGFYEGAGFVQVLAENTDYFYSCGVKP